VAYYFRTRVPGPVTNPLVDALRQQHHPLFGGDELPVSVDAIAEPLLGLSEGEANELEVSSLLLPAQREIWLNERFASAVVRESLSSQASRESVRG
jgi:hypothetical protein